MRHWREVTERGSQEFHREFDGVRLAIYRLDIPGAWACLLPDGKRVVGELRTVADTVELLMRSRTGTKQR